MALLGADTDELREVGKEFEEGKEITDDVIKFIQALIIALKAASFFSGGASAAYAEYLETQVLPWLQKISQALGAFAQVLNMQAQQQDDASNGNVDTGASSLPSYTGASNLPAAITPFTGGSIAGGSGAGSGVGTTPGTGSSTFGSTTGSTPGSTTGTPTSSTPVTPTTTTGATATPGSTTTAGLGDQSTQQGQPHWAIDSNGHVVFDTGIDTNGPDSPAGTTSSTSPAGTTSPTGTTTSPTLGTSTVGSHALDAVAGGAAHHPETSAGTTPITHTPTHHAGSGLGSGSGIGGGSGAGSGGGSGVGASSPVGQSSIDSSPAAHSLTPISHAEPMGTTDGGLGGATPGAQSTGHAQLSATGATLPGSTPAHASYGAAAGIAGGAAALGLGGAALAAKSGSSAGSDPGIDSLGASNGRGSTGADVKALQQKLTSAGYDTHGADGVWGRNTEAAYDAYRADHPLAVQSGSGYTAPDGYDYTKITGVQGNANVTPEFLRGVEGMSQRLGAKPEHILAAMSFETGGTFSPSVKNPHSSATGLIQFMDATAKGMGTSTHDLAQMTPTQQLPYVEKYFEPYRGRLGDLESVYTSVLAGHPASGDTPLFTQGHQNYTVNAGLDTNHDGVVTASEAAAKVRARMGR